MRAEFTAKQEEPNNFCLELESLAALRFEMARIAKKILLAIKACHPRGVIFLLALLIYVFAFFYHITLIFMKGTIAKTDDLESAMLINMAVRFLALLVMFILLLIFFVDPDEERLPVSDGESRRANIRDRTIP